MIGFNDLINKQLRFIGELKYNCTIPKLATWHGRALNCSPLHLNIRGHSSR
jgi:hypothetical protein